MPRKNKTTKRSKRGGGFFDSANSTLSSWGTSLSENAKKASSGFSNPFSSSSSAASTSVPAVPQNSTVGGKTRRKMRGGNYRDNISTTNLASKSASFDGGKTAQPHNWVGGKRRSRSRRYKKKN